MFGWLGDQVDPVKPPEPGREPLVTPAIRSFERWVGEYPERISSVIIEVDTLFATVFFDVDVALFAERFDDVCFE